MMKKRVMQKVISYLMVLFLLAGVFPAAALAEGSDIDGHWARTVIEEWKEKDLIEGYPDGSFRPDEPVTRAEFMTMANRAFGYSKEGEASFKDISSDDWFYGAVVSAADYISGYPDETMRPNNPISRQEVAKILASIAHLKVSGSSDASFTDAASFADWSKGAILLAAQEGYVNGYPDGSFKATAKITRAEALTALDNTLGQVAVLSKPGEYESTTYAGSLVLAHEDITLTDVTIEGDLVIGQEVGDGDVYLNDVVVKGDTFVRGGGLNSVYINGGSYKKVVVEKSGSGVRLVCTNNDGVEVSLDLPDSEVVLEGDFEKVEVKTEGIKLSFQGETTVGELKIDEKATNTQVKTEEKVVLKKAVVESKTDFTGQGTIDEAEGDEAEDSSFEKEPDVVNDVVTTPPEKPSGGSSSGGSITVNVDSISVSLETLVLAVYDSASIKASVSPSDASNKKVTWKSSDTGIATVDNDGKVTGIAAGTSTITATTVDGGETASTELTVKTATSSDILHFDSGTGTLKGFIDGHDGSETDLVIPAKINGVEVKAIGDKAFGRDALISLVIPNTVEIIGESAFSDNILEEVRIPDSVTTIGSGAFAVNKLKFITIPNSVTSIGEASFIGNELESLTIPASVKVIGNGAFNVNQLADNQAFIYGRKADGSEDKTKTISYGGAKIENVEIPNTVTTIGERSFSSNQLTSITIPDSVTSIEKGAFSFNQLTSINIPNSVMAIGAYGFQQNELASINIPDSVRTIGDYSFSENRLTSINIPNSVETIGEAAFYENNLTEVTIPDSVTSIEQYAFKNNGTSSESGSISTTDFKGTWEIKGSSTLWTRKPVAVTGITVTGEGNAITIDTPEGTLQMSAAVLPENATDKTVTWSVEDGTGKATIDTDSGLLTATAGEASNGTVTVKATARDGSEVVGTKVITISSQVDPNIAKVSADKDSIEDGTYEIPLDNQTDQEIKTAWVQSEVDKKIENGSTAVVTWDTGTSSYHVDLSQGVVTDTATITVTEAGPSKVVSATTTDSRTITLTMDKALTGGSNEGNNGFGLSGSSTNIIGITKVVVNGISVTITVDADFVYGDGIGLDYNAPEENNILTGADGDVANFYQNVTNTIEQVSATGIEANVAAKETPVDGNVNLTIETTTASNSVHLESEYAIYYRIVDTDPSAMNAGTEITLSQWTKNENGTAPFEITVEDGKHIELVEVVVDSYNPEATSKVARWGKIGPTDDGIE